jgi:integrase
VDTPAVLSALTPLWQAIPETADRTRARIEAVLDFAKAHGWRTGENCAAWRNHLALILPKRHSITRSHFGAMPYQALPAFVATLHEHETVAAAALEFAILTAARSGEILGAAWSEFDLETTVWTVPATRTKAGREHRVPLSGRATEILQQLKDTGRGDPVFPGRRGMLADSSILALIPPGATVHGIRSSFRDWCSDIAPREIAEACLAHRTSSAVEAAYLRTDVLERRRTLMEMWGSFCCGGVADNIIPMRA